MVLKVPHGKVYSKPHELEHRIPVRKSIMTTQLIFRALSDAISRNIIEELTKGDLTNAELEERINVPRTKINSHIDKLKDAGLVDVSHYRGTKRISRLKSDSLKDVTAWVAHIFLLQGKSYSTSEMRSNCSFKDEHGPHH